MSSKTPDAVPRLAVGLHPLPLPVLRAGKPPAVQRGILRDEFAPSHHVGCADWPAPVAQPHVRPTAGPEEKNADTSFCSEQLSDRQRGLTGRQRGTAADTSHGSTTRKCFCCWPARCRSGGTAVPPPQLQRKRTKADRARGVGLRPVVKAALRESLLAEPETPAVAAHTRDCVTPPRTENQQHAAHRVAGHDLPAERGEASVPFRKSTGSAARRIRPGGVIWTIARAAETASSRRVAYRPRRRHGARGDGRPRRGPTRPRPAALRRRTSIPPAARRNRRRRTPALTRIFPDEASCLRLIQALAVETHEEWVDQNRYLNMDLLREHLKRPPQPKAA